MLNAAGNIYLGGSADLQLLTGGRWEHSFQVTKPLTEEQKQVFCINNIVYIIYVRKTASK